MPTYRNVGQNTITYVGKTFVPGGEDIAVPFYVPETDIIKKVKDDPFVKSPIILVKDATNETIQIPAADEISICITTKSTAIITFADDDISVPLDNTNGYTLQTHWSKVGKIKVEGSARIIVERR